MDEDDLLFPDDHALEPIRPGDVPANAGDEIGMEMSFDRPLDVIAERLAERWGVPIAVAVKKVNRYASDRAARVMVRMRANIPAVWDEHRARITIVFESAMTKKPRPDLNTALKAAIALAQLDGFLTSKQVEMTAGLRSRQIPNIEDEDFMRHVEAVIERERESKAKDDIIDV